MRRVVVTVRGAWRHLSFPFFWCYFSHGIPVICLERKDPPRVEEISGGLLLVEDLRVGFRPTEPDAP